MNKEQFCPICNTTVNHNSRYPNYLCGDCVDKAQSEDGQLVKFYNIDFGGGCVGEYAATKTKYYSNIVYVNGVKCYASEAHFGGIVVRPFKGD